MSPARKRTRLNLRSRGRDDVLQQLVSEIRSQEKQFRNDLKRANKELLELRAELDAEHHYVSKLKREREDIRAQFAEASKEFDTRKGLAEKEIDRLKAELADSQRIKNMERMTRDGAVRQQTLSCTQKKVEKVLRTAILEYQKIFKGSGIEFDPDVESSDEEATATPQQPVLPPADKPMSESDSHA